MCVGGGKIEGERETKRERRESATMQAISTHTMHKTIMKRKRLHENLS